MNPVSDSQIDQLVTHIQGVINAYMAANFPTLPVRQISVAKGKRYAKIIATDSQRAVYGFLDLTNGNLLKAASWKAPALNFSRGNIHTNDLGCCGPHSIG